MVTLSISSIRNVAVKIASMSSVKDMKMQCGCGAAIYHVCAKYITYIPHKMGLPDQVASLWQILSFGGCIQFIPQFTSQTKQAMEPGVMPV